MLSYYSSIQNGADVCKVLDLPKELEDCEVEVIVKPRIKRNTMSHDDRLKDFLLSADKFRFDISDDYSFDRSDIYDHLDK